MVKSHLYPSRYGPQFFEQLSSLSFALSLNVLSRLQRMSFSQSSTSSKKWIPISSINLIADKIAMCALQFIVEFPESLQYAPRSFCGFVC